MLIIIVPVFLLTIIIAYQYRAGNTGSRYTPNWEHNKIEEFVWWGVPTIIIIALSVLTWNSTHALDPYRPIVSTHAPITIQVMALDWKWLFIYPKEGIATVNFVQFPVDTPVHFEISADAPMNSFWIPRLGGQMYAMSGMVTSLYLLANNVGDYRGSSANFSGAGFAGMKFFARASTEEEFAQWVSIVKKSSEVLDNATYTALRHPSTDEPIEYYGLVHPDLYMNIVNSFMQPASRTHTMQMNSM